MNVKISKGWIEFRSGEHSVRRCSLAPAKWLLTGFILVVGSQVARTTNLFEYFQRAVAEKNPAIFLTGGKDCLHALCSDLETAVTAKHSTQNSQLPTIRLNAPANTFVDMQRALNHGDPALGHDDGGDQPYFKATLEIDQQPLQRCKICLRGTMPWHHYPAKPSLRIRIKKEDIHVGDRYIELTRPEDTLAVKNWLPMQLTSPLGLISDQTDHVRVFINNKYMGVYLRSMRQGEPLALTNHRMPGTFFKGDFGGDLWNSLDAWKLDGEMAQEDQVVFRKFLELLQPPTDQAKLDGLREIFDFDLYARWAALMTVTGSIHTDTVHNHSYFFCANQGKLEALPWDCNSFGVHAIPKTPVDVVQHPVIRALMCDPQWVHCRNQWIYRLLTGEGSAEKLIARIDDHLGRVRRDLQSDRYLGDIRLTNVGWQFLPASPMQLNQHRDQLVDWIRAREAFLWDYLNQANVFVDQRGTKPRQTTLVLEGNVGVSINTNREDALTAIPGLILPNLSLSEQSFLSNPFEQPIEVPFLTTVPREFTVNCGIDEIRFVNAITGVPIKVQDLSQAAEPVDSTCRTIHSDRMTQSYPREIKLGPGTVVLHEDLRVRSSQRLVIEPGTVIQLATNVGIYSEGVVTAIGTKQQPIRLERLEPGQPWGAFAAFGASSEGSRFAFCSVKGGSTGTCGARRFKGMFNIYNCPQVTIRDCHFADNAVGDDTVNLAESKFEISRCTWQDALADGLDLDMSEGTISDCQWRDSGNDGLDMMTCQVEVQDCTFSGSGDKGISVGEGSRLMARRLTIRDCAKGTELKDNSFAEFSECRFINNEMGAHAYQKKPYYGRGGTGRFLNCTFVGNQLDLVPEKRCQFQVIGTGVDTMDGELKNVYFGPSVL